MKYTYKNLPNDPLADMSIEELGEKFRKNLISCKEVTSIYYERIKILNPYLHAYIYTDEKQGLTWACLLYTSPSPRDGLLSRMPSSA